MTRSLSVSLFRSNAREALAGEELSSEALRSVTQGMKFAGLGSAGQAERRLEKRRHLFMSKSWSTAGSRKTLLGGAESK